MNQNIYAHFLFEQYADKPLIHLQDGSVFTYEMINHRVAQFCHFFKSIGLNANQRIAVQTEKCIDAFCVYLASLRYGTIYIPLNPAFQRDELAYFIEDAEPTLFVCSPENESQIQDIVQHTNLTLSIETLSENNMGSIQLKANAFDINFATAIKSGNDIACILYTSGTTGKPKGAMLSHKNLRSNGLALIHAWQFKDTDTLLHMLPIFHCHGLFFACHCVLLSGADMFFLPKLDIDLALDFMPKSTVLMGVPTYYTRLLADARFTQSVTVNMRLFISGSAPLLEKTFYEFESRTGQSILERYGMTETGINTSNPLLKDRIPGSVGLSLENQTIRIVNVDNIELQHGEIGNIQVKGDNVFLGYWNKQDKTDESFTVDGYFKTGDIGFINKDNNYIYIIGRANDMIITGGLNVYPKEIESVIDKIDGVKESAVIGLPHADFGEAVTAVIVKNADVDLDKNSIINHVKSSLANYKVPKEIIYCDNLPRNTMGKVQKNYLQKVYVDFYN